MAYPSTLTSFTNPLPTDRLNGPSHSSIETAQNTGLTEIQTFVGTLASTAGTIIYDVRSPSSDGGGHVQTAIKGGTGQTTFSKGDILVASNSSALSRLAVASDGAVLKTNSSTATGVEWGAVPGNPTVRIYSVLAGATTTSVVATWVKPSTLAYIVVRMVGGGAPGGQVAGVAQRVSGGGASAAYAEKIYNASVLSHASVIVGNAGPTSSVAGNSSFFMGSGLTSVLVTGGTPGEPGNTGVVPGGTAGVASGGDVNINGQNGGQGMELSATALISGDGGNSQWGRGGKSGLATGATDAGANNGTGYGSGGSGNGQDSNSGALSAGLGKEGFVMILEY